jgi:hypothetical protein
MALVDAAYQSATEKRAVALQQIVAADVSPRPKV